MHMKRLDTYSNMTRLLVLLVILVADQYGQSTLAVGNRKLKSGRSLTSALYSFTVSACCAHYFVGFLYIGLFSAAQNTSNCTLGTRAQYCAH